MADRRGLASNKLSRNFLSPDEGSMETDNGVPPLPKQLVSLIAGPDGNFKAPEVSPASASPLELSALLRRVEVVEEEIAQVRKRQEQAIQKQEDAEVVRRGQLECLSERVYEAEKTQRQVQERTDTAIEKARAAFQKTSADLEQERTNLMSVITQVNQNFEHLSGELAALSSNVTQELAQLQEAISQQARDGIPHDLVQMEEQQANFQARVHQQMMDMQRQLMPTPAFRQEVADRLGELRQIVCESEVKFHSLADSIAQERSEVSVWAKSEINRQLEDFFSDEKLRNLIRGSDSTRRQDIPTPEFLNLSQGMGLGDHLQDDRRGDLGKVPLLPQVRAVESANQWLNGAEERRHFSDDDLGLFTDPGQNELATKMSQLSEQMMTLKLLQEQKALQHSSVNARSMPDEVHRFGQEQPPQSSMLSQEQNWSPVSRRPPDASSLPAPAMSRGGFVMMQ
eukprot:gb/GFBE01063835.1/.p1 GENE.gb/GFBE01063835.1/~~gb/GFBE01063835.1/.p1  ORF type:complete len:454 (+),score=89.07 gb/GFBE01063835.1/:1-1362(+)